MAEMNSRMNGSQCFPPPPSLCLRFPALQACVEDLPLVLQRPDNFPLVMGILQEINHEKVGSLSQVNNTCSVSQRPRDQQIQTLALSKVKLENVDIDQHSFNSNPDLDQEWSLKGVEELLTDSEELQLRHDSYQQAHEAAAHLEVASAREEKPLFGLQSTLSQFKQRSSDEAQLLLDEKPALCSHLLNSLKELEPLQGGVSPLEEFSEAKPSLHALQAAVLAKDKSHQQPSQACAEDSLGLDNLQVAKTEPEGHACCSEVQMQGLPAVYMSRYSEVVHGKENTDCIILRQSKDKITSNMDTELNKSRKTTLLGHKSQARDVLLSGTREEGGAPPKLKDKMTMNADCELHKLTLPESDLQLNLETGVTKRWTVHNILRSTCAILALPAELTEQEKIQVPQKPPPTVKASAAEGPMCPPVSSEGGADSPQISTDFKGGDRKHQVVDSSESDLDLCELTLSLGSSQPQTATCSKNLDCSTLPEEKPVVQNFFVQEEYHGQCQRTNPIQWQQAMRCGSRKVFRMPAYNERLLFSPVEGNKLVKPCTGREGSTKVMQTTSKIFGPYDSSPDEMPEKKSLFKQGQPSSAAGNHIAVNNSCLDGEVSRQTLRLMPQSSEDGSSALEKGEVEEFASEDDQPSKPNQKIAKESSNVQPSQVSSQNEQEYEFNEPQKKRMRGTLPIEEKGDRVHKEKDTRCHRSDGKSWRCVRECINGAYYCQYHLRARRIGYNRRKNRDTDTDHLESVSKKSTKSGKKSRHLLSTSNSNSNS